MRTLKFRAWDTGLKQIIPVHNIDFQAKQINTNGAWRMFNEVIVMQYTGLKDAKGTEIYEGDIVRVVTYGFDTEVFETSIVFSKAQFRLSNGRSMFYFGQSDFTKMDDAVVVGNIYEGVDGKPWQS